jgi:hypothetical protein
VDYTHLPKQCLKETTVEGPIQTRLYQAQLLHKEFAQPLNVVIIIDRFKFENFIIDEIYAFVKEFKLNPHNFVRPWEKNRKC